MVFQQQTLVSVGQMRLVEGFRVAQVELGGLQVVFVIKTRHFVQDLNIHTLVRLQTDGQFILRQFLPRIL